MRPEVVLSEPRLFRDARAVLAETPFWLDGALHWADIVPGLLHVSPLDGAVDGSDDLVLAVPPPLAAVQPADLPTGGTGWVAALGDEIVLLGADGAVLQQVARVEHATGGIRFNEGKVDPQGRFVVGSMNAVTGEPDGAWYRFGPDGTDLLLGGVAIANGLEWTLDERTVLLTDTGTGTIHRAPWDAATGPGEPAALRRGSPGDGLVIDRDGCFWNALNGEGAVVRLDPDGEEIERVALPAPNVAGVTLGGPDLATLFVTSAREQMTEEDLRASPRSGGVFAIDVAVGGLPVRRYRA